MSPQPPSDTIFAHPVMWPTALAVIGSTQALRLAEHRAGKDCNGGGMCELTVVDQAGLDLPDVEAFIAASATAKPLVPVTLILGYKSLSEWTAFTGYLAEAEYGSKRRTAKLTVLDDLPLRGTKITKFAVEKAAQDIAEALLAEAGIDNHDIDLTGASLLKKEVAKNETVLDLLNRLRDTAKIRFGWWFDAAGKFIWKPWEQIAAAETYVFTRGINVVKLSPADADELANDEADTDADKITPLTDPNEPAGPTYELETIPHPWLGPWSVVKLAGYEDSPARAKDGYYRVDTIEHRGGNETRALLTIRRLADE